MIQSNVMPEKNASKCYHPVDFARNTALNNIVTPTGRKFKYIYKSIYFLEICLNLGF